MVAIAKTKRASAPKTIANSDTLLGAPGKRATPTRSRAGTSTGPKRHRATDPEQFKTSMLNIRVKTDLKVEASEVLENLGISLPEAVRVFLCRVVREKTFPFQLEVPNAETSKALRESMASDPRLHASVEDMFDELETGDVR